MRRVSRWLAWPVELEVCGGCGVIIDIDAASCGCEYPPRRVSKTFYLMHEADFLALAAADREAPDERACWCHPTGDGTHAPDCYLSGKSYPAPAPASPDERLREALREIVAAFPSPPDREMDDEEIEKWYADHGDWFQRLAALAAADREAPDEETT